MQLLTIQPQFLISMPGGMEWIWIVLVVVLLFGGKKIPELARGIGKGIRDFNDAKKGVKDEIESGMRKDSAAPPTPPVA
jgi:sec-independent protein translocase protein TatA